jgi:hypothetical protein
LNSLIALFHPRYSNLAVVVTQEALKGDASTKKVLSVEGDPYLR